MRRISNNLYLSAATLLLAASLTNAALAVETGHASVSDHRSEGTQPYVSGVSEGYPVILSAKGHHFNVEGLLDAHGIYRNSIPGNQIHASYGEAVSGKAHVIFIEHPSKDTYTMAYDNGEVAHFDEFSTDNDGRVMASTPRTEPRQTLYSGITLQKTLLDLNSPRLAVIMIQCESLLHVQDKSYREKLAQRIFKNLEDMERFHKDDQLYTKEEIKFLKWYLRELNNKHTLPEAQANNDREMRKLLDAWHKRHKERWHNPKNDGSLTTEEL